MKDPLTKVSRRQVLKGAAAAGLVLSVPWLPGCGDDDSSGSNNSPTPTPAPAEARESRMLHLDLSNQDPEAEFRVHAIGSQLNGAALTAHDNASRDQLRLDAPFLAGLPDARLTHMLGPIDLPAQRIQHVWVTRDDPDGESTIVLSTIYVPRTYLVEVRQLRAAGMHPPIPLGDLDALENENLFISTRDLAIALVFHHPQVVRLEPKQTGIVKEIIQGSDLIDALADHIYNLGDAWVTKIPVFDVDGTTPIFDASGKKQLVQEDPSDATMEVGDQVVAAILNLVHDDPDLQGANWHLNTSRTADVVPSLQGRDPDEVLADVAQDAFRVKARYTQGVTEHGMAIDDIAIIDPTSRVVRFQVRNTWLRYVGVYVEFFNAANQRIHPYNDPVDWKKEKTVFSLLDLPFNQQGQIMPTGRCVNVLATNTDYLGIPLFDGDVPETALDIVFPPSATRARVAFGTLGLGGEAFSEVGSLGSAVTLIVNIGLPAFFIATSIGTSSVTRFAPIFSDPATLAKVLTLGIFTTIRAVDQKDLTPALISFGKIALGVVLKAIPRLIEYIALEIGAFAALEAAPIIGWSIKVCRIGAALAEIGQTVAEVTSGPAVFENMVEFSMATTVKIRHDSRNFQFPATATHYVVTITFAEGVSQRIPGTMPPGTVSDPIKEVFTDTPVGGEAKIDVWFFTANNWLVGQGSFGPYANFPNDPTGSVRELEIEERLVPLTDKTQYSHKQKLGVTTSGAHVWTAPASAPHQTAVDLNCDADSLCELDGITVSQSSAAAAYTWRAVGNVPLCGDGPTNTPTHHLQSISIAQNPDVALQTGSCGYTGKPLVAYELLSAVGSSPRNFYLDPSSGGFHLRAVDPEGTTPFDQTTKLSWGEFSQSIDSMAVHPAGYVVGVNTAQHRLEIIQLRTQPLPDEQAVSAVLKAGRGTRAGLLDTPIAVGIDLLSQVIVVLESGNRRLQAFDCFGSQVFHFAGGTKPIAALRDEGSTSVTYLDMTVEGTGYIYVLSYQNSGRTADDYRLDIYDPTGAWLSRTTGVAAARCALDKWRNLFTLNYEALRGRLGLEPSLSEWIASAPGEDDA